MALAEVAKLLAQLDLGGNFVKNLGGAEKALGKFDAHIDRSQSKAFQAGQHIGTGIKAGAAIAAAGVGLIATNVALGLNSLVELEQQQAQTNAVLKSTKGAAGISAQAVSDLAEKYESLNAVIGDEVIRSTENMLLTFTNVKGKAFEPALQAILDINTAMGGGPEGLQKVAIQVGKALNDPTKGLTALTRIGVTFDKGQVKRIKQLQKEGKTYEAQKIILAELNREFGGSFLAQGQTTAGKVAAFTDSIEDLQRALAEALLPTLGNVATALSTFLRDPKTVEGIRKLGQDIAKFFTPENIAKGISLLKGAVSAIAAIAGPVISVLREAISLFQKMPPWAQKLIIGGFVVNKLTGGGVTNIGGSIADSIAKGIAQGLAGALGGTIIKSILGGGTSAAAGAAGAAEAAGGAGLVATLASALGRTSIVLAPASVAAIGLAVDQAVDPNDTLKAIATAETAMGRGIQDWNNRGIQELETIAANTGDPKAIAWLREHGINISSGGIEAIRGAIAAGLQPGPGAGGRGPGTQGDVESRRGAIGDALSAAEIGKQVEQGVGPDIELVRQAVASGLDDTTAGLETVRGTLSTGLQDTSSASRQAGLTASNAAYGAARGIETAIANNRPIINVDVNISATTVDHTVTVTDRNGPTGGSATDDLRDYPH